MPDVITPMMMTQAVVLGCLFLGLIMQVIHAQAINKAERSMNAKLDELLERKQKVHGPRLEELINMDLLETMGQYQPATNAEMEQILKDLKNDKS